MQANGKKEVVEAVWVAVLSAALTSLVQWGIEKLKTEVETKRRSEDSEP